MANWNQFDEKDSPELNKPSSCLVCEAMLPDAVDGTLSEAEQKAFEKHVTGCMACAEELAEAKRGAAWLQMLKGHSPEPSASLLTRILARTSAAEISPLAARDPVREWGKQAAPGLAPQGVMMPSMRPEVVIPEVFAPKAGGKLLMFRRKVVDVFTIQNASMYFQPRLAMTAAMAFFSVALTLNMTGVKLSSLRVSDLRPSSLRRTVADSSASAARTFHNMRVVYQVESRLEDLRSDGADDERMHSASPYTEPAPPASGSESKESDTKEQEKPKGHSELQFPVMRAGMTRENGV